MSNTVMNFDQFSSKDSLEKPITAIKTLKTTKTPKEKFVDQVKRADLTQPTITEPDYSKTTEIDRVNEADENAVANLQSVVTAAERELIGLKEKYNAEIAQKEKDLQSKREALAQAITSASVVQAAATTPTQTNIAEQQPILTQPVTPTPSAIM